MEDPSRLFRAKYDSLKRTFERRLASLADAVTGAIEHVSGDKVLLQLSASESTRPFAPAHAQSLIKRHLAAERDSCFRDLAHKLADAEVEASRVARRNDELSSSVRVLQEEAMRGERSRTEVAHVKSEIRKLRHEYQNKLEQVSEECRKLKTEISETHHQSATLMTERDELTTKACSLQAALADSQARGREADLKGTGMPRLERELGDERSVNARLKSELAHAQERLSELAASHQKLKFQALSLRNDLKERDKRLQLVGANRKKSEVQFRAAVARMELLLEEESRDSASALTGLRDQALLVKNRLSTQIDQLQASNSSLAEALSAAKVEMLELAHRAEAAQRDKDAATAAAVAREEVLRAELQQARARADTISHSLTETIREQSGLVAETANAKAAAEVLKARNRNEELERARAVGREQERTQASANPRPASTIPVNRWEPDIGGAFGIGMEKLLAGKLEEASAHVSEMRAMLRQEVQRREAAETEVSEAQRNLYSSQRELVELRNLARKLEQMSYSSIAHIDEKTRVIKQLEGRLRVGSIGTSVPGQEERSTSSVRHGQFDACRSDFERVRSPSRRRRRAPFTCLKGNQGECMLAAIAGLRSSVAGVKTKLKDGKIDLDNFVRLCTEELGLRAKQLIYSVKGISTVLFDTLGVVLPNALTGNSVVVGKQAEGALEQALSEFSSALADAMVKVEKNAKRVDVTQSEARPDGALKRRLHSMATLDSVVWGDSSKDDFNMLAQLQKIEVESELQSLRTRLENMTEKYSRAAAARDELDNSSVQEARERAEEELARAVRAHKMATSALESKLGAERSRCQDLRVRLERQTYKHHLLLAESNERMLHTQQQLDKVQQALDHTHFTLGRELARRVRLERKLEENGIAPPPSVSPPGTRSPKARDRTSVASGDGTQPLLHEESSVRTVLEEARAKLGQEMGSNGTLASSPLLTGSRVGGGFGKPQTQTGSTVSPPVLD